ncbi:uncharacterized protein BDR25DRAFT_361434 [Lindgomyces ingoldianus]|uniref:Uncharacterized protein n=1 Tax=Lindgomyces ingoldianus TaxID=673940 RepID=A0ACB6QC29_9PLEO|nr:uncharacterized protein BDR25DRAFT_361434 [Lindgomyces ingoldianus]KAF2464594.1 hypothetical protein BDR25DRAFT_361434 [Lindgomyces ingoldianus]
MTALSASPVRKHPGNPPVSTFHTTSCFLPWSLILMCKVLLIGLSYELRLSLDMFVTDDIFVAWIYISHRIYRRHLKRHQEHEYIATCIQEPYYLSRLTTKRLLASYDYRLFQQDILLRIFAEDRLEFSALFQMKLHKVIGQQTICLILIFFSLHYMIGSFSICGDLFN